MVSYTYTLLDSYPSPQVSNPSSGRWGSQTLWRDTTQPWPVMQAPSELTIDLLCHRMGLVENKCMVLKCYLLDGPYPCTDFTSPIIGSKFVCLNDHSRGFLKGMDIKDFVEIVILRYDH